MGGKTLKMQVALQQCFGTSCTFFCPFYRSLTYVNFLFSENNVRFYSSAVKGFWKACWPVHRPDSYATLMSPNKGETAVHGCHCPGDVAVHMREVLARPWVGVCFKLVLLCYVYDRACLSYFSFSVFQRSVNFLGIVHLTTTTFSFSEQKYTSQMQK